MILSLQAQAQLFWLTVLLGGGMGLIYDGLRVFRRAMPHKRALVQLEDGLFWLAAVFLVFRVMLRASGGEIRFFSIFGLFGGMGLYFLSISHLVLPLSDRIIRAVKMVFCILGQILWTPFRLFFLIFGYPLRKIGRFCDRKRKKLLQSCRVYAKMKIQHLRMDWKMLRRQKKQ